MPRQRLQLVINLRGKFRRATLEGRPHLVVPGVILKEEVLNGSEGPVFYPADQNKASANKWNHIPIVVDHPKVGNKFVSARSPQWVDSRKVGVLFNTQSDEEGKLSPEFWFDEERTKKIDQRVYDAIINEKPMEVSTGLEVEVTELKEEATFNGSKYKRTASNYEPDHLAVLPDKVGALPVAKGGGLFANESKEMPESVQQVLGRSAEETLSRIGGNLTNNELSFGDTTRQLSDLLSAKFGEPGKYWPGSVCEVYKDRVIFRKNYDYRADGLWMISYSSKDDEVSLTGDASQVERVVSYQAANETYTANEAGDLVPVPMKENLMAFDKKAHLATLIGNGGYGETDRAWLEGLPDATLERIKPIPVAAPVVSPPTPAPPVANQGQLPAGPLTMEQLRAVLPPQFFTVHEQGQKALDKARAGYVEKIKANPRNVFSDAQLAAISDLDTLAAMAQLAEQPVANQQPTSPFLNGWQPDYLGAAAPIPGSGQVANQGADPPEAEGLPLPSLQFPALNGAAAK